MLKAKKNSLFEKIFARYDRFLFKRRFASFNVSGLDFLTKYGAHTPQIVYANHSSWWDGLVFFEIFRRARLDSYVMMEEKQLKTLQFFRLLGAFSVVRENPREAVRSIKYAAQLLSEPKPKTLLIFPQGKIEPNDRRPLAFYRGLSRIIEKTIEKTGKCAVLPAAIRYEFLGKYKPEIFVKIGEPELFSGAFEAKAKTAKFADTLTALLNELKNDIVNENDKIVKKSDTDDKDNIETSENNENFSNFIDIFRS